MGQARITRKFQPSSGTAGATRLLLSDLQLAMAKRMLLALILALALALVAASTDVCNEVNDRFDACDAQRTCSACVAVSGCAFSLSALSCGRSVSSSSANATIYCVDGDASCSACSVSAASPTCYGAGGCVCPSVCSVVSADSRDECQSNASNRLLFGCGLTACSILLMLYSQRKMAERLARHARLMRQRPGRPLRHREPRNPTLVPSLDGWRQDVEKHKIELADVELASCCYVKMDGDNSSRHTDSSSPVSSPGPRPEAATTGGVETTSSSLQTPRPGEPENQAITATSTSSAPASAPTSSTQMPTAGSFDQRGAVWLVTL